MLQEFIIRLSNKVFDINVVEVIIQQFLVALLNLF